MIYAVIDTNVFVAALLSRHPDSATIQVVNTLFRNGIWTIKDLIALTPSTMKMLDGAGKLTVEEITKFRLYFRPKENE